MYYGWKYYKKSVEQGNEMFALIDAPSTHGVFSWHDFNNQTLSNEPGWLFMLSHDSYSYSPWP